MIESVFVGLVADYLLTEQEMEDTIDYISKNVTGKDLKDMYASNNREYYAKMLILPYIEQKVLQRGYIKGVGAEGLQKRLRLVMEEIADSKGYQNCVQVTV